MKTFLKEVLLPLLIALCLAAFFKPVYMADGVCDYFLMWLCVGFPFGIRRMCLWLVPFGYGISGTVGIAPIPIATMSNREWGSIGTNYLKGLFALAFQGFLIMVCVAIYAVLINNMIIAANIHSALFSVAAYTVILCFSLFKTGSLAKSLFNAH